MGRNFHDGRTWMYQTQKEICAIYPYWTEDMVHKYIKKLVDKGVLVVGNYNKTKFDQTKWYAFKNQEKFTKPSNDGMDPVKGRNQSRQTTEPIPDTKTDTKKTTTTSKQKVVAVVSDEDKKKQEENINELHKHLMKIAKKCGDHWKIPIDLLRILARKYGYEYLIAQVNNMISQEEKAAKSQSNAYTKTKTKKIENPTTWIKLSCEKNYAMSEKH